MQESKQFEGKNLESAIQKACDYFNKDKENLEIEVLDEGTRGIFGLGGQKPLIKAQVKDDREELKQFVQDMIKKLVLHIVDNPEIEISVEENKIHVTIELESNRGLIIGKEGQNLEALEYLCNRILNKNWSESYYIQLDAGGYRDRQDENLKQKVHMWAKNVKKTGKVQRTGPLSAYHRRLVHLELQDEKDIITKSVGEGPVKRVLIISQSKGKKQNNATGNAPNHRLHN